MTSLAIPQSPAQERRERILGVNEETDTGTLLTILTDTQTIADLQKSILEGEMSYLSFFYLFVQHIGGTEKIKTTIGIEGDPGKFHELDIKGILNQASKNTPSVISSLIQRIRGLYQSTEAFEKTKPFGDMIHRTIRGTQSETEAILA